MRILVIMMYADTIDFSIINYKYDLAKMIIWYLSSVMYV